MTSPTNDAKQGLFASLWRSGLWRLFPFLLIYSIGLATIFPVTPTLVTNGFASIAAGHHIDCQDYTPATSPVECRNAHSTAVTWSSWTSFVEGCVLTFLFAPVIGHLSDRWGRKPFMLIGISFMLVPVVVLILFVKGIVPIYWYYPASALNGLVSSFNMCLTSVADLLEQKYRSTAVGFLMSCFSVGIMVGPILGGYMSVQTTLWTCLALTATTLVYVAVFVKESAPFAVKAASAPCAASLAAAPSSSSQQQQQQQEPKVSSSSSLPSSAATAGTIHHHHGPSHHGHDHDHGHGLLRSQPSAANKVQALGGDVAMDAALLPELIGTTMAAANTATAGAASGARRKTGRLGAAGTPAPAGPESDVCEEEGDNDEEEEEEEEDIEQPLLAGEATGCSGGAKQPGATRASASGMVAGSASSSSSGSMSAAGSQKAPGGVAASWALIRSSGFYQLLALLWVVLSIALSGAQGLLMQYLQLTLGFNTRDQAHLLVVLAAGGLVVKLGLLPPAVRYLGEQRVLVLGLLAYCAEDIGLALAPTKPLALAAVTLGSLSSVTWPALWALQTSRAAPEQQGAVAGALQGISSLASGMGPLAFAALFSAVTRTDSSLPYMPGVVWYAAAGLSVVGVVVAALLPRGGDGSGGSSEGGSVSARQQQQQQPVVPGAGGSGGVGVGVGVRSDIEEPLLG